MYLGIALPRKLQGGQGWDIAVASVVGARDAGRSTCPWSGVGAWGAGGKAATLNRLTLPVSAQRIHLRFWHIVHGLRVDEMMRRILMLASTHL